MLRSSLRRFGRSRPAPRVGGASATACVNACESVAVSLEFWYTVHILVQTTVTLTRDALSRYSIYITIVYILSPTVSHWSPRHRANRNRESGPRKVKKKKNEKLKTSGLGEWKKKLQKKRTHQNPKLSFLFLVLHSLP